MAALDAGAREILRVRWVAADGDYSTKTFVEGVRARVGHHGRGPFQKASCGLVRKVVASSGMSQRCRRSA